MARDAALVLSDGALTLITEAAAHLGEAPRPDGDPELAAIVAELEAAFPELARSGDQRGQAVQRQQGRQER